MPLNPLRPLSALILAVALLTAAPPVHAQEADAEARRRAQQERLMNDWANLERYREDNARLAPAAPGENRVVFMGNSITQGWAQHFDTFFPGKPYVGRGISGQTTPQMLVRFRQDVIDLDPSVVVILAGTNDIAGNTGPATPEMIQGNIASMAELARANGIRVVLSSILPASEYPWRPGLGPGPKIVAINDWMRAYAAENDFVYLDYHTAMADDQLGLPPALAYDGVHPTEEGYRVMSEMVETAIAEALGLPLGTVYSRLHTARKRFIRAHELLEGEALTPARDGRDVRYSGEQR